MWRTSLCASGLKDFNLINELHLASFASCLLVFERLLLKQVLQSLSQAALEERKLASFMESLDISTQDCVKFRKPPGKEKRWSTWSRRCYGAD